MRMQKKSCACLIPCYNEARRIVKVLSIITQSKTLAEIVVVDDGSTDDTVALVKREFPNVTLITQPTNSGKTAAIAAGLKKISHEYVFLCDADLGGLKITEVDDAVTQILTHPKIGMVIMKRLYEVDDFFERISDRTHVPFDSMSSMLTTTTFSRMSCLLSGERALRTKDLQEILTQPVEQYEIEAAINQYYFEKNTPVCWMPSSATNSYRFDELGFLKFIEKYVKMHTAIIRYLGVTNYRRHFESFCLDQCPLETTQPVEDL